MKKSLFVLYVCSAVTSLVHAQKVIRKIESEKLPTMGTLRKGGERGITFVREGELKLGRKTAPFDVKSSTLVEQRGRNIGTYAVKRARTVEAQEDLSIAKKRTLSISDSSAPLLEAEDALYQKVQHDQKVVQHVADALNMPDYRSDAFTSDGRLLMSGSAVSNAQPLMEHFSLENQLIALKPQNKMIENMRMYEQYVGYEKQFEDPQAFVDALVVERSIQNELLNTEKSLYQQDCLIKSIESYDRAIDYVCGQHGVEIKTVHEGLSAHKPLEILEKTNGAKADPAVVQLQKDVKRLQDGVDRQLLSIKLRNQACQEYKEMVEVYDQELAKMKKISLTISEIPYQKITEEEILSYKKQLRELQLLVSKMEPLSKRAMLDFEVVRQKYISMAKTIAVETEALRSQYKSEINSARLDAMIFSLNTKHNEYVRLGAELDRYKDFFENFEQVKNVVASHEEFIFALENKNTLSARFFRKGFKRFIEDLFEMICQRLRIGIRPASLMCLQFSASYTNFTKTLSPLAGQVKEVVQMVANLTEETVMDQFKAIESLIMELIGQLMALQEEVKGMKTSPPGAPLPFSSSLPLCAATAPRMQALAANVEALLGMLSKANESLSDLYKKALAGKPHSKEGLQLGKPTNAFENLR